jgi:hypothetical protein
MCQEVSEWSDDEKSGSGAELSDVGGEGGVVVLLLLLGQTDERFAGQSTTTTTIPFFRID